MNWLWCYVRNRCARNGDVIMGTKKGQKRKTARRAYMPKKKKSKKKKTTPKWELVYFKNMPRLPDIWED